MVSKGIILNISVLILSTVLVNCSGQSVGNSTLTEEQIRNLTEAKIEQKNIAISERNTIMIQIDTSKTQYLTALSQFKVAQSRVFNAYNLYYKILKQCNGLASNSSIIGVKSQISNQTCPQFPIQDDGRAIYASKLELQSYNTASIYTGKVYNDAQKAFTSDAQSQLALYKDLKSFFELKKNNALGTKYNLISASFQNFYNLEKSVRDQKLKIFEQAKALENNTSAGILRAEGILQVKRNNCLSRLSVLKNSLNSALLQAINSKNNVSLKKSTVNSRYTEANNKIQRLKTITSQLNQLVTKYYQLVSKA